MALRRDVFAVVLISFVSQPHGKNSNEKSEKNNDFFVDSKNRRLPGQLLKRKRGEKWAKDGDKNLSTCRRSKTPV